MTAALVGTEVGEGDAGRKRSPTPYSSRSPSVDSYRGRDRVRERERPREDRDRRGRDRSRSREKYGGKAKPERDRKAGTLAEAKSERGVVKSRIIVPNQAIPSLLDHNRRKMDKIVEKTGCFLSVKREVGPAHQDGDKVYTESGDRGRVITLQGTPRECADAYLMLQEAILDLGSEPGRRHKDPYYKS